MSSTITRLLAVGTAAAVTFVGFAPAVTATAQPAPLTQPAVAAKPVVKAAKWLAAQAPESYTDRITLATGLAVLDAGSTAATLRGHVAALQADAVAETADKPGTAANLAILAEIMRLDPADFGGADLLRTVTIGVSAGKFTSAYGQSLAIIALKRGGAPVPATLVAQLLASQATTGADAGAFGYEWPIGTFNADPDSTALSIQALRLVKGHGAAVNAAVAWAKRTQKPTGYWEAYSPVDSTSLLASALQQVGRGSGKAKSWLKQQQLPSGAFAASVPGTDPNLLATSNAAFGLTGKALATAKYALKPFTVSPRPKISGTPVVGQILTANARTWKPAPTSLSYQWYRNGKKITGATASTYTLTTADAKKRLRVLVKAKGIGLKTDYELSKRTKKIKQA